MKRFIFVMMFVVIALAVVSGCKSTTGRTAGSMVDDTTIANTIRAKIVEDKELSVMKINTDVFNGNVTLLGAVPSKDAENHLVALAKGVKGVKSVTSKLMIEKK